MWSPRDLPPVVRRPTPGRHVTYPKTKMANLSPYSSCIILYQPLS